MQDLEDWDDDQADEPSAAELLAEIVRLTQQLQGRLATEDSGMGTRPRAWTYTRASDDPGIPSEPSAYDLLPWRQGGARLHRMHERVWVRRLRSCEVCGADFRGPRRRTRRCPNCRQGRR